MFVVAMTLSAWASAATAPETDANNIKWSASTGVGYDSNVYQAPGSAYTDYAAFPLGSNPVVNPKIKSGLFVPYEVKMAAEKINDQNSRLLGSASLDGIFYAGGGLSDANEYNLGLKGGPEYVISSKEKSEDTVYVGAVLEKHKQVYVDHDSGAIKTTTSGADISNRYSYTSIGVEAKYKHTIGRIDYGVNGQYILNDYEDPIVVSQLDHSYYTLGADASIPVANKTRLNLSFDHKVRDYSKRHAHDAQGIYSSANPLLLYTYNVVGVSLRNRISPDWLLYLDFDHTQRADGYVSYNDYNENRYGIRVLYEQGRLKARLAMHHWGRDYPNGFAFDVAGQGSKTYNGNVLKFKAELEQTRNSSFWTELLYKAQHTTDLRYDYVRTQVMAGMSWAY